jgi:hypothetical protein
VAGARRPGAGALAAPEAPGAIDALVRRAAALELPLSEGVALILAQLRRAAGRPDWPPFDVRATPGAAPKPPPRRRQRRR